MLNASAQSVKPRPNFYARAERVIEKLIHDFWLNSHKHRKVMARGMELLVPMGLTFDRERLAQPVARVHHRPGHRQRAAKRFRM